MFLCMCVKFYCRANSMGDNITLDAYIVSKTQRVTSYSFIKVIVIRRENNSNVIMRAHIEL